MRSSRLAGRVAPLGLLTDDPRFVAACFNRAPEPSVTAQEATSEIFGHRGSSFKRRSNAAHVVPITQASGLRRTRRSITGPIVFDIALDALSAGTMRLDPGGTANLAVLGGKLPPSFGTGSAHTNGCIPDVPRAAGESPATTGRWPVPPRPLLHRSGSARAGVTTSEALAAIMAGADSSSDVKLQARRWIPCERMQCVPTTHRRDALTPHVDDLAAVIGLETGRAAKLRLLVDHHRPASLSIAVPADKIQPGRPTSRVKLRCPLR